MLRDFTLENFRTALARGDFFFFLQNSLIIAFSAVILTVVVCVPMAHGLTKIGPRPREAMSFAVLAMRFLPYVVLALPILLIFLQFGLSGTRGGLLLAHLAIHILFATWLMMGLFDTVPHEVEEAAITTVATPGASSGRSRCRWFARASTRSPFSSLSSPGTSTCSRSSSAAAMPSP